MNRNLAASGPTEKMFFPTQYANLLILADAHPETYPMADRVLEGFQVGVAPHGF